MLRTRALPISTEDREQLLGEHHIAISASFAMPDVNDHPGAIDVLDRQRDRLSDAQTRRVLQQELVKIWQATRKSVLFITHDIDEAIILGTRIGVMTAGPASGLKEIITVDESVGHDRRHPNFMEFFKIIHALIEEEVNKTLLREQDTHSSSVGGSQT